MKEYTAEYVSLLRENLTQSFNKDELITLCTDLSVNYDDLPGDTLSAKARELLAHLQRRDRLDELIGLCLKLRPNVQWQGHSTVEKRRYCVSGHGPFSTRSRFCPVCGVNMASKDWEIEVIGVNADEVKQVTQGIIQAISESKYSITAESQLTITCPICEVENPKDALFCKKCGQRIVERE